MQASLVNHSYWVYLKYLSYLADCDAMRCERQIRQSVKENGPNLQGGEKTKHLKVYNKYLSRSFSEERVSS